MAEAAAATWPVVSEPYVLDSLTTFMKLDDLQKNVQAAIALTRKERSCKAAPDVTNATDAELKEMSKA